MVVLLDPCRDPPTGLGLGGEVLQLRSSNSTVECQLSMTALSSAEPTLPIDWVTPTRPQAARKFFAVYSLPWSVCMMHLADGVLAAADRDRHRSAAWARSASWCSPMANPTMRREPMSNTESR